MPVSILPQPSTAKCRLGRPQGSKTKDKTAATPTLELVRIISIIEGFLCLIVYPADLPGVLDGYCGNPTAVLTASPMPRAPHLHTALRRDVVRALRQPLCRDWPTSHVWQQAGCLRYSGAAS